MKLTPKEVERMRTLIGLAMGGHPVQYYGKPKLQQAQLEFLSRSRGMTQAERKRYAEIRRQNRKQV